MFNLVPSVKNRNIISDLSIEDFVSAMRNPDPIRKSQILEARKYDRKHPRYISIKESLPSLAFNFYHENYVNGDTILYPTGYLYIDVDNFSEKINYFEYPFICAAWKSLSNNGLGILCKVDGLNITNYKEISNLISKEIGISNDNRAISKDRLSVLGFDTNIYYNNKSISFVLKDKEIKKVQHAPINNEVLNRLVSTCTNSNKIRFNNLDEYVETLDFNGEPFIDLGENKIQYAQVIIPKKILEGSRNFLLFCIVSQIYGLNKWMDYDYLLKWAITINRDKFHPVLGYSEIEEIVLKVFNKLINSVILNKERRIIFNPDYNLSQKEKQILSARQIRKSIGDRNTNKLLELINSWDFKNEGKITQQKLSILSGFHINTIKNKFETIKQAISFSDI